MKTAIFDRKFDALLYGMIGLLILGPFIVDLLIPLGTAVWLLYLIPITLSYMGARPYAPPVLAGLVTVLLVIGYFVGPMGGATELAQVNRTIAAVVSWLIAGGGVFAIRNRLAVRREEWLQTGELAFSSSVKGEQSIEQLGRSVLVRLADYLGAQAGAVYFRNDDDFVLSATYGVPSTARIPDRVLPGEGLLGQAVEAKRSFVLNDVPDNYLYFGSGLGQAKPRHLLITVAVVDGEVGGVMELGFADPIDPLSIALLERISEAAGFAIRSAEYRRQLQNLLAQTQKQPEELQVQSEELRASNEELEAQSRSLRESQARLEAQQSELEESNAQLETQRDELTRIQRSLEEQARELERASRYKSEFLANMSHELRTPLNSLLIMARLLAENRNGNLTPEQVKFAETIETSGNDLLVLINDILDISKIEAGHLELNVRPARISPLLTKLKAAFEQGATAKGLSFTLDVDPGLPPEIETDPQRLEQVLRNFLSNAVKFTEKGGVTLQARRRGDGRLVFSVKDTGVGIAPEQQSVIFEAFRQADGTISRKYGGTGLGLSISRELTRLLGGRIEVQSAEGRGSVFSLVVPEVFEGAVEEAQPRIAATPAPAPAASERPSAETRRPVRRAAIEDDRERLTGDSRIILVVEDDPSFARVLYDMAHEAGFACLVAETADEGVVMARQYLPVGVILDMGLPDHTGLTVLDRLKRDMRTRHIPVHVVSGKDHSQAARAYGAAGYSLKPVRRDELMRVLEGLETQLPQRMRRVLIVEDDITQLDSLMHLLATRDVETVQARSAADCLDRLGSGIFDCMVLDLNLPDRSGLDLLETLSQDESVSFPPVIVYTGKDLSADEELRLRKYSKSIIIKGARSPERLLDEVTLFLHQVVAELPERHQTMLAKSLSRDAALEGRRILVVEDDIRNVYALTSILEPHGVLISIARNGLEALKVLEDAEQPGAAPVDLVLMDVMMPEMDGLTATREIRKRSQWRSLPIITLTAKAMAHDQEQCLAAGANDYLAKPLDVDKLLSLVRVWMPR